MKREDVERVTVQQFVVLMENKLSVGSYSGAKDAAEALLAFPNGLIVEDK